MNTDTCTHECRHRLGEIVTHATALRARPLAALLVVAGGSPAASSRLASGPAHSTLGRVQLRVLG